MADNQENEEDTEEREPALLAGPVPRDFTIPGNDVTAYLGVAPEYRNYSDPVDKPYMTEREAYLYGLTNEQVLATRERRMPDGVEMAENEKPAIAEDTGYDFAAAKAEDDKAAQDEANKEDDGQENRDTETPPAPSVTQSSALATSSSTPTSPPAPQRAPIGNNA